MSMNKDQVKGALKDIGARSRKKPANWSAARTNRSKG